MQSLIYPLIVAAGILQAMGNAMNAQLNKSLVNPFLAASVSFLPIAFVFITLLFIVPKPLPTAADFAQMPWWAPLGGLAGAVAVFTGLLFTQKIGAGPFSGVLIASNMIFAMVLDHFGLLGLPPHAASAGRIIGGVLMIAGVGLISLF